MIQVKATNKNMLQLIHNTQINIYVKDLKYSIRIMVELTHV